MIIFNGILAVMWTAMLLSLFSKKYRPDKFVIGCAFFIVALVFIERFIELL